MRKYDITGKYGFLGERKRGNQRSDHVRPAVSNGSDRLSTLAGHVAPTCLACLADAQPGLW